MWSSVNRTGHLKPYTESRYLFSRITPILAAYLHVSKRFVWPLPATTIKGIITHRPQQQQGRLRHTSQLPVQLRTTKMCPTDLLELIDVYHEEESSLQDHGIREYTVARLQLAWSARQPQKSTEQTVHVW